MCAAGERTPRMGVLAAYDGSTRTPPSACQRLVVQLHVVAGERVGVVEGIEGLPDPEAPAPMVNGSAGCATRTEAICASPRACPPTGPRYAAD
jgi:hypothetical protein